MSIDMLFSQPVAQNPSTGIHSDKTGPCGADPSAGYQTLCESTQDDHDDFMNTLKQVSRTPNQGQGRDAAAESKPQPPPAADAERNIDEPLDPEISANAASLQAELDEQTDLTAAEWNLTAFVKLLERLGFENAAESANPLTMANANPANSRLLAGLELLISRLQQPQFGAAADLKVDLQQLQQFLAATFSHADGGSARGLSPDLVNESAQITQRLAGLIPDVQGQKAAADPQLRPAPGSVNVSPAIAAEAEGRTDPAAKSPVLNGTLSGLASTSSTQQTDMASQSEARSDAALKLSTDSPPSDQKSQSPAVKNDPESKPVPVFERADVDAAKTKGAILDGREPRTAKHIEPPGRMATTADPDHPVRPGAQDRVTVKPGGSSGQDPVAAKMSEGQIQSPSDSAPLSKVLQEAQLFRDGGVKATSNGTGEGVGKVIKSESATPDNGLMNSSGQDLQKSADPAAVQKQGQADQAVWRNQTLEQIVRRAAIHLKNGQHEAQIDLKPDFLGHIRMQVISANHQVTVKILAEHGFVKDMIESNIHQLKADLNQQGLEVDKLEVTVSRDPEDSGNYKDKLAQWKNRSGNADRQTDDQTAKEKKRQNTAPARAPDSTATVDYFA